ncbi:MAG: DUF3810 domain-containing protein [bacterium]|nr:DUF3810 domain-containing protein [bacterium]
MKKEKNKTQQNTPHPLKKQRKAKLEKEEEKRGEKKNKTYALLGVCFAIVAILLRMAAMQSAAFADWYAQWVYPIFTQSIGRISSLFPFSLMEFGGYLLLLAAIVLGIRHWRQPLWMLSRSLCLIGLILLLFVTNSGVNYYRHAFSYYLDWEMRDSSATELWELCILLTKQLNEHTERLQQWEKEEQVESFEEVWGRREYTESARSAMRKLGETYPQLSGYYPQAKSLAASWLLSVAQLAGIYCPYTIEANYNADMIAYNIPHTVCHELSHLKGFMREDEANFIAYLACVESGNEIFQYSGAMLGWIYATNALYGAGNIALEDGESLSGAQAYAFLSQQVNGRARADMQANNLFWDRYESKVSEVANQVNDTYLKINSQEDGVKSYGRVVDLMLAYYREKT